MFLQNSRKEYNRDSEKPAPWKWFKGDPNNPYKVPILYAGLPVRYCLPYLTAECCLTVLRKGTKGPMAYNKAHV